MGLTNGASVGDWALFAVGIVNLKANLKMFYFMGGRPIWYASKLEPFAVAGMRKLNDENYL